MSTEFDPAQLHRYIWSAEEHVSADSKEPGECKGTESLSFVGYLH